jgi:hypothetical protein
MRLRARVTNTIAQVRSPQVAEKMVTELINAYDAARTVTIPPEPNPDPEPDPEP